MKRKALVQSCKSKANNKAYKAKTSINNKIIHYIISKVVSSRECENRKNQYNTKKSIYECVCVCFERMMANSMCVRVWL